MADELDAHAAHAAGATPPAQAGGFRPGESPEDLGGLARQQNVWVAVAESLTGGALSSALSAAGRARAWFRGGVVAYDTQVKFDVLGVTPGPVVTARCAREMASGVAWLYRASLAVSTTGVGGPGPEEDQPEGSVLIGWFWQGRAGARRFRFDGPPDRVVGQSVVAAVALAVDVLRTAGQSDAVA